MVEISDSLKTNQIFGLERPFKPSSQISNSQLAQIGAPEMSLEYLWLYLCILYEIVYYPYIF